MAIVDELITLLGFETKAGSDTKVAKFKKSVKGIVDQAKKAALAISAMTAAVGAWAIAAARGADEALKFSRSVGTSIEDLQRLEFAAGQSGTSVGALRGILEKAAEFGFTGADGIARLADSFKGLDARTALLRGQAFGFSEEQVRLLRVGGDEIRKLAKEADALGLIITEEQALKAEEFTNQINKVKQSVSSLARQAAINALPAIQELTDAFLDWFIQNRALISSGLTTFIEGVTRGTKGFIDVLKRVKDRVGELLGPLDDWFDRLDKVEVISGVVTGGLVIMAAVLGLIGAKFIVLSGLIGLATLAIEDLLVFFQGGDSLIGRFFEGFEKKFPGITAALSDLRSFIADSLGPAFETFGTIVVGTFEGIKTIIDVIAAGLGVIDAFLQKRQAEKFQKLKKQQQKLRAEFEDLQGGNEFFGALSGRTARREQVRERLFKVQNKIDDFKRSREGQSQLANVNGGSVATGKAQPATAPINPAISAQRSSTVVNGDTIYNIDGSKSPEAVANEISRKNNLQTDQQLGSPGTFAPVGQ